MNKKPLNVETIKSLDPDLEILLKELVNRELSYQAIKFYSGKVIDNNDPEKLGRCKIRVFGIYDDAISDGDLPWALPDDHFIGSFRGSMIIPPKQALVRVYFDHGDIYAPVYTSKIPEKKYKSEHMTKDYPDTLLFFETDNGDYFTINKKRAECVFHAAGGALIRIDNKGNVTVDTTEADVIYGGAFKLNVNGDVEMKTIGNVTIDAVGPSVVPPMINPLEPIPPTEPRISSSSKIDLNSTGTANLLSLGTPPTQPDPIPDPKDPTAVAIAAMSKFKTGAINIIAAVGDINVMAVAGSVKINATTNVDVVAPSVAINAGTIDLGEGASDGLIKSNAFTSFFDSHTHPTSNGPSGPPIAPMSSQSATLVSQMVKTV